MPCGVFDIYDTCKLHGICVGFKIQCMRWLLIKVSINKISYIL